MTNKNIIEANEIKYLFGSNGQDTAGAGDRDGYS